MKRRLAAAVIFLSFAGCAGGQGGGLDQSGAGGGGGSASGGAGGSSGGSGGMTAAGGAGGSTGGSGGSGGAMPDGGGAGGSGGTVAGNPCSSRAGLVFCDDFEAGLSSTRWTTPINGDGTVTVDTSAAHSGTKSLHVNGDRKSTRLNSSHLGISYAVFCLKKKTNK